MKLIISTHFFFLSKIVKAFLLSSATRRDSRGSGGTDFNKTTIEQLKQAQFALNNRPRKILGYKTPGEIMNQEINNYAA